MPYNFPMFVWSSFLAFFSSLLVGVHGHCPEDQRSEENISSVCAWTPLTPIAYKSIPIGSELGLKKVFVGVRVGPNL